MSISTIMATTLVSTSNALQVAPSSASATRILRHQRSDRSLSPSPAGRSWSAKRLFRLGAKDTIRDPTRTTPASVLPSLRTSSEPLLQQQQLASHHRQPSQQQQPQHGSLFNYQSAATCERTVSSRPKRDISPDELRRFLSDDKSDLLAPLKSVTGSTVSSRHPSLSGHSPQPLSNTPGCQPFDTVSDGRVIVAVADDLVEEEDDANFATSAIPSCSDGLFSTMLSPPPIFVHCSSRSASPQRGSAVSSPRPSIVSLAGEQTL